MFAARWIVFKITSGCWTNTLQKQFGYFNPPVGYLNGIHISITPEFRCSFGIGMLFTMINKLVMIHSLHVSTSPLQELISYPLSIYLVIVNNNISTPKFTNENLVTFEYSSIMV